MKYRIEEKPAFSVVGIKERFSNVNGLGESVGKMWSETPQETVSQIAQLGNGLVGVYSGMYEDNTTDYYIAAITDKNPPENLCKLDIAPQTWAVFEIEGPMPTAMAEVWGKIFTEWFPESGYEHANAPELEWYSNGDMSLADYKSEIWIPVVKK